MGLPTAEQIANIRRNLPASDYTFKPVIDRQYRREDAEWEVLAEECGEILARHLTLEDARALCVTLNS